MISWLLNLLVTENIDAIDHSENWFTNVQQECIMTLQPPQSRKTQLKVCVSHTISRPHHLLSAIQALWSRVIKLLTQM